jgi:hypothetical protein
MSDNITTLLGFSETESKGISENAKYLASAKEIYA